jgi:hypothetical protein
MIYIGQMLCELAELADEQADDDTLGALAFDLRLLAAKHPAAALDTRRKLELHSLSHH